MRNLSFEDVKWPPFLGELLSWYLEAAVEGHHLVLLQSHQLQASQLQSYRLLLRS
jgi:hypothetical protein